MAEALVDKCESLYQEWKSKVIQSTDSEEDN
jgi:hypothetical protein